MVDSRSVQDLFQEIGMRLFKQREEDEIPEEDNVIPANKKALKYKFIDKSMDERPDDTPKSSFKLGEDGLKEAGRRENRCC